MAAAPDVSRRFDELKTLRAGWLDGAGAAFSGSGLDRLASAFADNFPEHLPLPRIYPTPEGDVQFEWSLGDCEISLDIALTNLMGNWHSLNLGSDLEVSRSLALGTSDDWRWVADQLSDANGVQD